MESLEHGQETVVQYPFEPYDSSSSDDYWTAQESFDEEDSNINEESDLGEIDEDDDLGNQSMEEDEDQDNNQATSEIETMDEAMAASNWPPQNIPLAVPGDKNKKKPGIIFLSSIPPGFNVSCTIAFFSQFGKVGRVFLQPGNDFIYFLLKIINIVIHYILDNKS